MDDKLRTALTFILTRLKQHRHTTHAPLLIGLNGIQGAGKTTLVAALATHLSAPAHGSLRALALSIDDLYLPRAQQAALTAAHPRNALLATRGQPGTHDLARAAAVLAALRRGERVSVPRYDKGACGGLGDRRPESEWSAVEGAVDVVLFEGWCVGFRALGSEGVKARWRTAVEELEAEEGRSAPVDGVARERREGRLGRQPLESVAQVDAFLEGYDQITDQLDAFVHLDAEDIDCVYGWRLEQEHALRAERGTGMSDEYVVRFVNGYYPSYELYTERLREGLFGPNDRGRHLRLVVGPDRALVKSEIL